MKKLSRSFQVVKALGLSACLRNGFYRLLLRTGYYKQSLPFHRYDESENYPEFHPLPMVGREKLLPYLESDRSSIQRRFAELREKRFYPFFGSTESELNFVPVNGNRHWAVKQKFPIEDLKLIWEPARFCWVTDLIRAEALTLDGKAGQLFLNLLDQFMEKNPVNGGENWESAQEVGMRLMNIAVFGSSILKLLQEKAHSEEARREILSDLYRKKLGGVIYEHAKRIPPTLLYARSQRNNHLLSEAAALMTASMVLPEAEESEEWFQIAWKTIPEGLRDQFNEDGVYIQQSSNYLRLALTLIIWIDYLLRLRNMEWPEDLVPILQRAVMRLFESCDESSGHVCNTGHNDGTLFFSFGSSYSDYRPVMQAFSKIFMRKALFEAGPWDEMGMWLNVGSRGYETEPLSLKQGALLRLNCEKGFALLRTASFFGRPAHDDLLHTEIWLNGVNECIDAGTYRYSAAEACWRNPFKDAFHHNVLTIDRKSPMTDGGKFLWLDWDSCKIVERDERTICAEHFAYKRLGVEHIRRVTWDNGFWVTDEAKGIDQENTSLHRFRLHWLIPDQAFSFRENLLTLERITMDFDCPGFYTLRVIRGGKCVFDSSFGNDLADDFLYGWYSPTYNEKVPALSVILTTEAALPFKLRTGIFENK